MTYEAWEKDFKKRRDEVLQKLYSCGYDRDQIVAYFDYENMVENEPEFCVLYNLDTKCHDTEYLNCFNCACPHFVYSEPNPLFIVTDEMDNENVSAMSKCKINSRFGTWFRDGRLVHQDCTGCLIPHTHKAASKELDKLDSEVGDSISILEWIRGTQLSEILGKFKLF